MKVLCVNLAKFVNKQKHSINILSQKERIYLSW